MTQPSLLFSVHHDLQSTHRTNCSTSSPDMAHPYHETPSPEGWWNYENASFTHQRPPTQLATSSPHILYTDSPIDSPYTQSPQMDGNHLHMLPYSPPFPPMQSRPRPVPEFAFPAANMGTNSQHKQWTQRTEPQIYETHSGQTSPGWPLMAIQPFDSNSWNEMIMSALEADSQCTIPSPLSLPYLLPCPSPSPSLSSSGRLSPLSSGASSASSSRRSSVDTAAHTKTCSHCAATSTPLWRRDPATHRPLCNACGLYLQQRNKMRPAALIAADQREDDGDGESGVAPGAPECSHCHTHRTSVWRRSKTGAKLCNACGVYARLRGRDRPLSLRRNKIRPRCKHPKQM
ncbi:hypothetical protein C8R43DRAFT_1126586 [Mycena crocata]|nr:hypothetical protein C8R43DRAFT_1126586 [Mycena crocata]